MKIMILPPKSRKLWVFSEYGKLKLLEEDFSPSGSLKSWIEVKAFSINPVDWKILSGEQAFITGRQLHKPHGFASDFSGLLQSVKKDGTLESTAVFGMVNPLFHGSASEYLSPRNAVYAEIPRGLSFIQAAAFPAAGISAYRLVYHKKASWWKNKRVILYGASGGVGHLFLQKAASLGAECIVMSRAENHETLLKLGACKALDYRQIDFEQLIQEESSKTDKSLVLLDCHGLSISKIYTKYGSLSALGKLLKKRRASYFPLSIENKLIPRVLLGKIRHPLLPCHITLAIPSKKILEALSSDYLDGSIEAKIAASFSFTETKKAVETAQNVHSTGKIIVSLE